MYDFGHDPIRRDVYHYSYGNEARQMMSFAAAIGSHMLANYVKNAGTGSTEVTPFNVRGSVKRRALGDAHSANKRLKFDDVATSSSDPPLALPMPRIKRKPRRRRRPVPKRTGPQRKRSVKRSGVRSGTVGYKGKFAKTSKRPTHPSYYKGAVERYEDGGIVSNSKVCYIGHSTQMRVLSHRMFWCGILRYLLRKSGRQIRDLNDTVGFNFRMRWHRSTDDDNLAAETFDRDYTTVTLASAANDIISTFYLDIAANNRLDFVVTNAELRRNVDTSGTVGNFVVANVNLRNLEMTIETYSQLRLQNQTKGVGNVGDEENANEVNNNPLIGKMYDVSKGSILPQKQVNGAVSGWNGITPNGVGLIDCRDLATYDAAVYSRPPHRTQFKYCKKATKVYLGPGQVKSHVVKHKWKGNAASFLQAQRRLIVEVGAGLVTAIDVNTYESMGNSTLFGFEKVIDTRVNTEPDIQLGWQLNITCMATCLYETGNSIPAFTVDIARDPPPI